MVVWIIKNWLSKCFLAEADSVKLIKIRHLEGLVVYSSIYVN